MVIQSQRCLWQSALLHAMAILILLALAVFARAADLTAPKQIKVGDSLSLQASKSGTLFLFGPGYASKRKVEAGEVIVPGDELRAAGHYTAILGDTSAGF